MDFFEAQARARRRTSRLLVLFGFAIGLSVLMHRRRRRVLAARAAEGAPAKGTKAEA